MRLRAGRMILMAVVVCVPVSLGLWQLDRARQKQEIRERALARAADEAVRLPARPGDAQALEFRTVLVEGHYEPAFEVFIDNRLHEGRPGFEVVTPLKPVGSDTRVLVNRGWVPWAGSAHTVPAVAAPRERVRVRGSARIPVTGLSLGASSPLDPSRATVWQHLDLEEFARQVPFAVQPVVVLLDPEADAGGFVRQWPGIDDAWIERHRAYAVQWFALALVGAILLAAYFRRARGGGA